MKLCRQLRKRFRKPKARVVFCRKKQQRKTGVFRPINKKKPQLDPENQVPHIIIFESEIKSMAAQAEIWGNLETGGELYGYLLRNGTFVIMLATPPGKNAIHRSAIFQQDYHFFLRASSILFNYFSLIIIGNWHSHHFMDLKTLSRTDIANLNKIAQKNNFKQLCQILVTFDHCPESIDSVKYETNIKSYYYPDATFGSPQKSPIKVISGVSPIRKAIEYEDELKSYFIVPQNKNKNKISFNEYKPNYYGKRLLPQFIYAQVDQFVKKNNLSILHKIEDNFIVFQIPLFDELGSIFIVYDIRIPYHINSIFYKIDVISNKSVNISDKILINNQAKNCFDYAFQLGKKLIVKQISQNQSRKSIDQNIILASSGHVTRTDGDGQ